MRSKVKRKTPEIVLKEGKPSAVILDIDEYRQILERLEELEDLNMLKEMRKRPLKFRTLEDFLKEYHPSVKDSGSDLKIEKRVSSIKKLAYSNAEWGLRFRLRPRGASAPEGEPSGSERLRN